MKLIQGVYNQAVCYADTLEELAIEQISALCDQPAFEGCQIRIMPDVHAGKGCTIGTTMTIRNRIPPSMVGADIGCGMDALHIDETDVDFQRLDNLIRREIPSGHRLRGFVSPAIPKQELSMLRSARDINMNRAMLSFGTLGGGNHFIELDRADDDSIYLVVHSGSRSLGTAVADHYCRIAIQQQPEMPESMAYLEGECFDDYIHDMKIVQHFASLSRQAMLQAILDGMGWHELDRFTTIHNYIDTEHMMLRKGSISAQKGEKLLIPINMRDGALICIGKGNEEWNFSAPHGAGRLLSRSAAKVQVSLEDYRRSMDGIFTTCVSHKTLDESPMAYKSREEIMRLIEPSAEIAEVIRPIYNFKASD